MTLTPILLAGAVVFFGKWSEGKKQSLGQFMGLAVAALFLEVLGNQNSKFATTFGWLIFFGAFYIYGPTLTKSLNRANGAGAGVAGKAGN